MRKYIVCLDNDLYGNGGKIIDIVSFHGDWGPVSDVYVKLGFDRSKLGYMPDDAYGRKWYKESGYT